MTEVKICGIREEQHALVASEAGASLLGFVFVPVRRAISPECARQIIASVRKDCEYPPAMIGLFVNESTNHINSIVEQVGLDVVQLHGDEIPEQGSKITVPAIKALRIESDHTEAFIRKGIEAYLQHCAAVLLDSHVPGHWGGTGVTGDWELAAKMADDYPVILAGGLTPENVAGAIETVRPAAVDVSSGIETNGEKDPERIRAFIRAAQDASTGNSVSPAANALHELIATSRMYGTNTTAQPPAARN
jgi:phosphoribosylanthranilate isomerase